jgi:hypothetical protein
MTTQYKKTEALGEFLEALRARKTDKGDEVARRHSELALQKINPNCISIQMWIMDTAWEFVPVPKEGEPKDPVEAENLITKIKDDYYSKWTKALKEGRYDPNSTVTDKVEEAEEKEPEPKPNAEIKDTYEEAEDIATEADKVEVAETAPAEEKKELKLVSQYAKEQYPATSHQNTMVGMLKTFVMDVVRNEVDLTAKESPKTFKAIDQLIDEVQELKKQNAELTARADKAKDVILNLVKQVKALQQPKAEGVEGL